MSVLEHAQEVCDEEAAKHQAHGEQGGVGVGPLDLHLVNGHVAVGMHLLVLTDEGVEGIVFGGVQMLIVQDQWVGLEDLKVRRRTSDGETG